MTLAFPNPSRSFDATRQSVRFWGYDSAIEVSCYIEVAALRKLCPKMDNLEAGFLTSYDSACQRIHKAADKVYTRGRGGVYVISLSAEDF